MLKSVSYLNILFVLDGKTHEGFINVSDNIDHAEAIAETKRYVDKYKGRPEFGGVLFVAYYKGNTCKWGPHVKIDDFAPELLAKEWPGYDVFQSGKFVEKVPAAPIGELVTDARKGEGW